MVNAGSLNNIGKFSGSNPSASITKSAFINCSVPCLISGLRLPESSAEPSCILAILICVTFSLPIYSTGSVNQLKSTPSSIAFSTSLCEPGIFF